MQSKEAITPKYKGWQLKALVFTTGATALGFQSLWLKGMSLTLGSTSKALSTVVAIFLLGLAIGSWCASIINKNANGFQARPLITFGVIEFLGSQLAAASCLLLLVQNKMIYQVMDYFGSGFIANFFISSLFILPSTIFLGMGLPFLSQDKRVEFNLSRIYALNALGGAVGCSLFGMIVPYYLDYIYSIFLMSALSLTLLIFCLVKEKSLGENRKVIARPATPFKIKGLPLAIMSGFLFLIMEIASERMLGLILGNRAFVGILVLSIVLLSISLGAWTIKFIKDEKKTFILAFTLAFASLAIIYIFSPSAFLVTRGAARVTFEKLIMIFFGIVPLLFSLSLFFPTCLEWIKRKDENPAYSMGHLLGFNTIASLVASLLTAHVLFSILGINGILALLCLGLAFIFIYLFKVEKIWLMTVPLLLSIAFFSRPIRITSAENIILQIEDADSHFTVLKRAGMEEVYAGNNRLVAPWKRKNIKHAQDALAYFPALYKSKIQNTLMIGLGYGITMDAFLNVSSGEVEAVEILKGMYDVTNRYHELNGEWEKNPRSKFHRGDGYKHIALSKKKYDIISVSLDNPYTLGGAHALSKEFYQLSKSRLSPEGIFSQMIWGEHMPEFIATLKSVFKYVKLLPAYSDNDFIVIASNSRLELQKGTDSYKESWVQFDGTREVNENIRIGESELAKVEKKKARFIISKYKPTLEFGLHKDLGLLWVRK
jgi:spermidine synthase